MLKFVNNLPGSICPIALDCPFKNMTENILRSHFNIIKNCNFSFRGKKFFLTFIFFFYFRKLSDDGFSVEILSFVPFQQFTLTIADCNQFVVLLNILRTMR
jgi:hypothetical protein